ncbi:MAG: J domain-containing protein [Spirochaetales bacterium]|nr:J domain-containing protein [Spirochaetales bacterium]
MRYLDYYSILNLPPEADIREVESQFRILAKKYHPDVNGNSPESLLKFRSILEAYKFLSEQSRKTVYDTYVRSSIVRKRIATEYRGSDDLLEILKVQLNYILWEVEDLIRKGEDSGYSEAELTALLAEIDKGILIPCGQGDSYFSARQITGTYTPLSVNLKPEHPPYTGLEDYFYQIRKRSYGFIRKIRISDLVTAEGDDSLLGKFFQVLNTGFSILGRAEKGDENRLE